MNALHDAELVVVLRGATRQEFARTLGSTIAELDVFLLARDATLAMSVHPLIGDRASFP